MAFLFRTSFCLLTVLFYSTSYCVPIESVENFYWKQGTLIENSGLRAPRPFLGNILQLCRTFSQNHSQKLICLLCKGFDISCLISTAPSTPSTTALPQTTTSTLPPTTTPGLTSTTQGITTSTPGVSTTTPGITTTTPGLTTTTTTSTTTTEIPNDVPNEA